jgi:hypothetical protein
MNKNELNYQDMERKRAAALFEGKCGGIIMGKERDFALKNWKFNLWDKIKNDAITYFEKNDIDWHIYAKQGHILSSQVCCINHLFPLRHDKDNVLKIAQLIYNDFIDVLQINTDKYLPAYIQFEAVSDVDHLNEGIPTRGSNCTSVDALIYAVHKDGRKFLLPIEWKYTEKYTNEDKSIEDRQGEPKGNELRGKERLKRYSTLIDNSKFLKKLPSYRKSIYFYEPFYQLMRQTLWAEQMIRHKNDERIKADDYIHIHVIPNENDELLYKKYKLSRKPLRESWLDNLKDKEKYIIISPMDFISNIDKNKYNELMKYLQNRYWSGKIEYIWERYWANAQINRNEYINKEFEKFDNISSIGTDVCELFDKISEDYSPHSGPMGLFAPKVLENEREIVYIIDYASLRNATVYAVFSDKKSGKITRKMSYEIFLNIYDSLLESGFSEINIHESWRNIFIRK